VVAVLAALYLGITILQALGGYTGSIFSSNLLKQLQSDFYEKASQLPLQYFQREAAGEFFTKFNNDLGLTQRFIADLFPSAVRELITAVAVTAILFYFCPATLTIAALLLVVITSILVLKLNRLLARYAQAQRAGWGEINRLFDETVQGIDTLKLFAAEQQRGERFHTLTAALRQLSVRAGSLVAVFSPGIELVSKLGGLLLIFFAYYLISRGDIRFDPFLLFFFYSVLLQASVSHLINSLSNIQNELTAIRNISSFLSEHPEEDESGKISAVLNQSVSIEVRGLAFAYPGGRTLFQDANLYAPSKGVTVIHGPSGSGKSTLINLLLRFYAPERGSILLGGIDIRDFTREELRKQISVVTQFHHIFHESLKANLQVAKPDATDEEIRRALEQAQLGEFLSRLPHGIDEVMDPRGKGISGGEKQRVCIARLLLRNSPIMVLDEPWSNLDEDAREVLARVINELRATTTILILTHEDLPSLSVDQICHLDPDKGIFVQEQQMRARATLR
jgi:subfamily B ATP-binding cassette protein MsbA